ncbi:MAG: hypothetical protein KME17_14205 [Cyanosarcina radialis HA8281-LM2]|nr:hypothetical protein [Cyanosarcina radialis HA8281-LM2]
MAVPNCTGQIAAGGGAVVAGVDDWAKTDLSVISGVAILANANAGANESNKPPIPLLVASICGNCKDRPPRIPSAIELFYARFACDRYSSQVAFDRDLCQSPKRWQLHSRAGRMPTRQELLEISNGNIRQFLHL